MKLAKEANKPLDLIVALKAEKRRLDRAIEFRRRVLAGQKFIDLERDRSMAVPDEIKLFGA